MSSPQSPPPLGGFRTVAKGFNPLADIDGKITLLQKDSIPIASIQNDYNLANL